MTQSEVLQQTIALTKEGSYSVINGTTTVKTLNGVLILSCSDTKITLYTPFFNENICEYVSQEKYGEYDVNELTEETLERILTIFNKRLQNSINKYKQYLRGV